MSTAAHLNPASLETRMRKKANLALDPQALFAGDFGQTPSGR